MVVKRSKSKRRRSVRRSVRRSKRRSKRRYKTSRLQGGSKFVNVLLSRYNANILNNLSKEDRLEVINIVKENPVISKLIKNWKAMKQPIVRNLSGPMSLTEQWSEEFQKRVYTFGEWHGSEGGCYSNYSEIHNYFKRLFNTTSVFIDFFLEVPAYEGEGWDSNVANKSLSSRTTYLRKLRSAFVKCIQKVHRHSEDCQLIRAHYADVRMVNRNATSYTGEIIGITYNPKTMYSSINNNIKYIYKLSNPDINSVYKYLIRDIIWNNKFIVKEIKQIQEPLKSRLVDSINAGFIYLISKLDETRPESLTKMSTNVINSDRNRTIWFEHLVKNYLTPIESYALDVYTFIRMFKTFKQTVNQPSHANNVIIYAGDAHAKNIRYLLSTLGFKVINRAGDRSSTDTGPYPNLGRRCLNMEAFPQPLFN